MNKHKLFISGGLLLLAAALCLVVWNLHVESRAGRDAAYIAEQVETLTKENAAQKTADDKKADFVEDPTVPMPVLTIDGKEYIGMLDVPERELSLPIFSEWNEENLKQAPCRYKGSLYSNDLIIMARDYKKHFGPLKDLGGGGLITFTDADENKFVYLVQEIEELDSTDTELLEEGDWDLTLFTYTKSGKGIIALRCFKLSESDPKT